MSRGAGSAHARSADGKADATAGVAPVMDPAGEVTTTPDAPERGGPDPGATAVRSLTGVYHADGGVRGELAYVVGKAIGRAHCALCDITHGRFSERDEWRACRAGLPVPFATVHRNERTPEVAAATDGWTPSVVAHTDGGVVRLLGPADLEACGADPAALVAALERAVDDAGLRWA